MFMPERKEISDYIKSLLAAEICNRCPICGDFEKTVDTFTSHHINHDNSISEYWNLIRICEQCHKEINSRQDGKRDRKIKQIKKYLFRSLIGTASYEVLLLAKRFKVTSTLPCLAASLLKLDFISIVQGNSMTVGVANHPTIGAYALTKRGKEIIEQLELR